MAHATDLAEIAWIKAMFGGDFSEIADSTASITPRITHFQVGLMFNALAAGTPTCPAEQSDLEQNGVGGAINPLLEPLESDNYIRKIIKNTLTPIVGTETLVNSNDVVSALTVGATSDIIQNDTAITFDPAGSDTNNGLTNPATNSPIAIGGGGSGNGWDNGTGDQLYYVGLWAVTNDSITDMDPLNLKLIAYVPITGTLVVTANDSVNIPAGSLQLRLS